MEKKPSLVKQSNEPSKTPSATDTHDLDAAIEERFRAAEHGVLELSHLGLETVPDRVRRFRDWEYIDLDDNALSELPAWFWDFEALEVLSLSRNRFRTLPEDIGRLRHLVHLGLAHNRLESLPRALQELPLTGLYVHDNPALNLPESLSSPAEILRYYFELRTEAGHPLLELKLLLVGRGKAGKTTLVKQLAGETPSEHESETHSIAISDLTLNCPDGQVRTRAWDFGGQEILYSTHQFFLTERSLYVLVLDADWPRAA